MAEQQRRTGQRIAQARRDKRWKQKHLANAVHVEPTTVSRWETGRHVPDLDMIEKIAAATEKPVSFFVDEPVARRQGHLEELEGEIGALRAVREGLESELARIRELRDELEAPPKPSPGRGARRARG